MLPIKWQASPSRGWWTEVLAKHLNQPKSQWFKFWPKKTPMWGFCNDTLRSCPKKHVRSQNDVFYKTKRGFVLFCFGVLVFFWCRKVRKNGVETHGGVSERVNNHTYWTFGGRETFLETSTSRNSRWLVPRKKNHRVFQGPPEKNDFLQKLLRCFFRFFVAG